MRSLIRFNRPGSTITLPYEGDWPPPDKLWLDLADPGTPLAWQIPMAGCDAYEVSSAAALPDELKGVLPSGVSRGATYTRVSAEST